MGSHSDEKLDRIVEGVQAVNINVESLRVSVTRLVEAVEDHESRLRSLERWQNNLTPVFAVITFVLGVTFTQVIDRLL